MARAYITEHRNEFEGGAIGYMVQVVLSELGERFSGPPTRNWDAFKIAPPGNDAAGIYTFMFRSGIDRLIDIAHASAGSPKKAAKALGTDGEVNAYVARIVEALRECEDEGVIGLDDSAARSYVLGIVLSGEIDPAESGSFAYYDEETDVFLAEAANSLNLPTWGRIEIGDEGAAGSGFDAAFVVLDDGRDLDELAAWFKAKEGLSGPKRRSRKK